MNKTQYIIDSGTTENDLWGEFKMSNLHDPLFNIVEHNEFLQTQDDCGAPCIPLVKYEELKSKLLNSCKGYEQFLQTYLEERVSQYESPRKVASQIALRGSAYYESFVIGNVSSDKKIDVLKNLKVDIDFYNICQQSRKDIPKEFVLMVIDHIKNILFKVMYGLVTEGIEFKNFNINDWYYLDSLAKSLWEGYARVLFEANGKITGSLDFTRLISLFSELKITGKIKELDSPKNLLRFARSAELANIDYTCCASLLYGGIEIPYALHGYNSAFNLKINAKTLPVVFSTNRVHKGIIDSKIIDCNGVINKNQLHNIIPSELINKISNEDQILIVDNNITTGYSVKIVRNTLEQIFSKVYIGVPEIYFGEIKKISERNPGFEDKDIFVSGEDLAIRPIDKYVTCFGVKDSSKVVNRIMFLLKNKNYQQIVGYDFDDTIAETGYLHGEAWDYSLKKVGFNHLSVSDLPSNSGMTNYNAGLNIYNWLIENKCELSMPADNFAKQLVKLKFEYLMAYDMNKIPIIASTVNKIIADSVIDTQIIVTNNNLEFIVYFLKQRNLLQYFSYIICADYGLRVNGGEKIKLTGNAKPSIDAYTEARKYFKLPPIREFYGDSKLTDKVFAERIGAKFHLV